MLKHNSINVQLLTRQSENTYESENTYVRLAVQVI